MKLALHWQILIAIVLGIVFGIWFYPYVGYVGWTGTLFLRLLNMLVLPLIFCSIISAIGNLPDGEALKRMGFKTIGFYACTTLLAILTGMVFVTILRPGVGLEMPTNLEDIQAIQAQQKSFVELLMNMIPNNVVEDMSKGNMLPVIFFAFLAGTLIHSIPSSNAQTLKNFFRSCFELMMQMTLLVVRLAPIGVFGLIAVQCAKYAGDSDKLVQAASSLGMFMLTSFLGMGFHFFITLSIVLIVFAKVNPIRHMVNMLPSLLTAFSTATSNATIPLSMECLEKNSGVSRQTSGFVIPLGATLNMNGTALYECVIVIFLSQAYGLPLSLSDQVIMVTLVMLAAAGTAGIPMASFVMTAIALRAVGLPLEGLGVILAIDRILDMTRTTVNIYGDTCCAVYIARSEGEELKE
ncbi:MAG: dicarboxylate/amino acid:cation symporter [Thermoguttaceae bacterium]|nr:dicarboxylate/amino acid:cation symporter [Thermoguttaceae bacterium]